MIQLARVAHPTAGRHLGCAADRTTTGASMWLMHRGSILPNLVDRAVSNRNAAVAELGDPNRLVRSITSMVPVPLVRRVLAFCLFEAAFYLAYRYGMSFSQVSASPFWFPDSVLLCALLLSRPRRWWILIFGALPIRLFSEVATGIPHWFLLTTFAIDSVKGALTALALRRFIKNPLRFET